MSDPSWEPGEVNERVYAAMAYLRRRMSRTCNHPFSATCPVCTLVITTSQAEEFDPQLIPGGDE